jgi:hypothetical protein
MQRNKLILFISFMLFISACKKDGAVQFSLQGKVTDADDGNALSGVAIEVEKQVVQNGVFGNTYQNALSTSTDNSGQYQGSWPRENFAALRVLAEKDNYIKAERELDINSFDDGMATENIQLYKEGFVSLRFVHSNGNTGDRLSFTFLNANFDCNCCANGWRTWQAGSIDTTITCRVYGNRWLKYQVQTQIGFNDSIYVDSLFCDAFVTTSRAIQY